MVEKKPRFLARDNCTGACKIFFLLGTTQRNELLRAFFALEAESNGSIQSTQSRSFSTADCWFVIVRLMQSARFLGFGAQEQRRYARDQWRAEGSIGCAGVGAAGKRADNRFAGRKSLIASGRFSQGIAERNHDCFIALAGEGKLQVTGVFDFSAELTKLISYRMDNVSAIIRKGDFHVAPDNSREAHVQQLPGHNEAIALWLFFNLDIDLVGFGAVEHLSRPRAARAYSAPRRFHTTVEQ